MFPLTVHIERRGKKVLKETVSPMKHTLKEGWLIPMP